MHYYNPIVDALYYGKYSLKNMDELHVHNMLLDKWKAEKKELTKRQKEFLKQKKDSNNANQTEKEASKEKPQKGIYKKIFIFFSLKIFI